MKSIRMTTSFVNHTIKNEVNKIALYIDIINNSLEPNFNEIHNNLKVIGKSSQHLVQMAERINNDLSDISVVIKQHKLNLIITEAINMVQKYKFNNSANIIKQYNSEQEIYCDAFHLREVLINILKNSIEAADNTVTIIIDLSENENNYVLTIEDDGCGIPSENLKHVIKPFFSTKNRKINYGIGLTYCYNVMKKHNGYLSIYSNGHKGTKIFLEIPKIPEYRKVG